MKEYMSKKVTSDDLVLIRETVFVNVEIAWQALQCSGSFGVHFCTCRHRIEETGVSTHCVSHGWNDIPPHEKACVIRDFTITS
jgi:hypothetical protein